MREEVPRPGVVTALRPGFLRIAVPERREPVPTWAYVFRAADRLAVVDPGFDSHEARGLWDALIRELGLETVSERLVWLTHIHPDRPSVAGWLAERLRAVLLVCAPERRALERLAGWTTDDRSKWFERLGVSIAVARELAARWTAGWPSVVTARPVVPGRMLVLGTDPATVWWTSGHTPGHGALILKSGDMLTGDLVLEGLTPNVSRVPGGPSDPLAAYLGALATLSGCKCPAVYPARGRVTDVRREATRIAGHHRLRLARTEELLAAPKTVAEVATVLFGLPRLRRVEDQRLALGETLAHLEYLARQGRVIRLVDGVPTDGHRRLEGLLRTASSLSYVVCPTSA